VHVYVCVYVCACKFMCTHGTQQREQCKYRFVGVSQAHMYNMHICIYIAHIYICAIYIIHMYI